MSQDPETPPTPIPAPRPSTRNRLIWLLIALSLVPGVIAATLPAHWAATHPAVQWTAYGISGILGAASVVLIMTARD